MVEQSEAPVQRSDEPPAWVFIPVIMLSVFVAKAALILTFYERIFPEDFDPNTAGMLFFSVYAGATVFIQWRWYKAEYLYKIVGWCVLIVLICVAVRLSPL